MRDDLNIIPINILHADLLSTLHKEAFQEAWSIKAFQDLVSMPAAFGFLAENKGMPVGFIICQGTDEEAEIITIATKQGARRSGVGRILLERALQKVPVMFLEVADDNVAAKSFYLTCGFAKVGRRPKYYKRAEGQPMDALVMRYEAV